MESFTTYEGKARARSGGEGSLVLAPESSARERGYRRSVVRRMAIHLEGRREDFR